MEQYICRIAYPLIDLLIVKEKFILQNRDFGVNTEVIKLGVIYSVITSDYVLLM